MPTTLLIEPFGGMAGDMFLAALLDLGDPRFTLAHLERLAEELVPGEARLASKTVWRGSLSGLHLDVATPETTTAPHRHLADLVELLQRSSLGAPARARAGAVLRAIAVAEGRVHGCSPDEIHFHEVGAVDTLIDVGGAALALELLGVQRVLATPPLVGSGTVRCAHGDMPVPAPATAELLRGLPHVLGGGGERLTPTAAGILAAWVESFEPSGGFTAQRVGYGAGTKEFPSGPPNIVRVQLGRSGGGSDASYERVWLAEANLDDATPQEVGHAVSRLRAAGALEVWTVAVQMKKDRPGVVLSALARAGERGVLERAFFGATPTLGVRWTQLERRAAARTDGTVEVDGVVVRVKRRLATEDVPARVQPEYDDLVALADRVGVSLERARELVLARVSLDPQP
ncbi:MAG: nickel pincer cofactor biosynthesis protein LarC [Planctomycetota bacterium]